MEALETLGDLLADRGHAVEVVAIRGGSLLLLDLIKRPTKGLDIVAIVRAGSYVTAKPLPDFVLAAVRDVAEVAGLAEDWLNPGPTSLLDFGPPAGFEQRVETQRYGGLLLHIASRFDQITLREATISCWRREAFSAISSRRDRVRSTPPTQLEHPGPLHPPSVMSQPWSVIKDCRLSAAAALYVEFPPWKLTSSCTLP